MRSSIFIPYGPTEYPLRSNDRHNQSNKKVLGHYSNAPPISDSRAAPQSFVNSELDDPFVAHLEFSGLNVGLSIVCVGFSGLDADSELDGPFITCGEFSGLIMDSELDGLSIACIEFSVLNVDWEQDGLSVVHLEFSGFIVDSELDGLFVPRLEFSGLNTMSSTYVTVVF